jgi:hypothetical protein
MSRDILSTALVRVLVTTRVWGSGNQKILWARSLLDTGGARSTEDVREGIIRNSAPSMSA